MRDELNSIVKSLILKVRESNQTAFEELLDLYSPLITSFLNKFKIHSDTPQDAEDFKQELIMVLYNSCVAFDIEQSEVSFGLYTKICMNNALVTQIRALNKRRDASAVILEFDGGVEDVISHQESPEHELIEREKLKEINGKIEKVLSELENKIWKMYIAGYSTKEMAQAVNKNEKSVDNAIYRIRNKLKPIFIK